ncbi:MAG: NAD-dependent epimerase/dehydratase family protein [Solirubrobacterales bacterium]
MRVFVAGASGAVGRPLIPRLLAAGHEVTGMTRSPERAARIREAGAEVAVCDVFDPAALEAAVAKAAPEAVIHQLTSLPERIDPRRPDYGANNRIRTEGTRNLLAAARAAGARRVVAQGVAFMYAPEGGWVKDEEAPLMRGAPGAFGESVEAAVSLEEQVTGAGGIEGLVLRYGWFYGPGTFYAPGGSQHEDVRRRARARGAGDLQRRRRRARAAPRVAAGLCRGDRRPEAPSRPGLAGPPGRRPRRGRAGHRAAGGVEREGQEGSGLGARLPELAHRLPRGAGMSPRALGRRPR